MSFWDRVARDYSPPAPAQHQPTASSRPWFDQRPGTPAQAAQPQAVPQQQQYGSLPAPPPGFTYMQLPNGQLVLAPEGQGQYDELAGHDLSGAAHLRDGASDHCPECRSPNYMLTAKKITKNGPVESFQCFDCGFPVQQSGSGQPGGSGAASGYARQVITGGLQNNFNPKNTAAGALRTSGDMSRAMSGNPYGV